MVHPYPGVQASELDVDLSDTIESPVRALLGTLDTHLTFDPTLPGKHHGHLILPYGESSHRRGHLRLPVCVIRGHSPGRTVTMLSGIHGDEVEGPLTLQRLAKEVDTDALSGCLILLPVINLAGLQTGARCSPLDARDLDRCFPGNVSGSISERVGYEVFERFIRHADLLVDLRSGGTTLRFADSAAVRFASAQNTGDAQARETRRQASEAAMIAFGAPNSVRLPASQPNSCLQAAADGAGTAYLQTELGGGGSASAQTLDIARTGCDNLLRHTGLLAGDIQLRATRMLEVRDNSFYVHATTHGILHPHRVLGSDLYLGDPLLSIVDLCNSGSDPCVVRVPRNGVLLALRDHGPTEPGDLLAIIADEVQR